MKSLQTGKAVFKLMTSKHIAHAHVNYNSKYCLSTQANEVPNRSLKIESEQKTVWESTLPSIMENREIKTGEDWKAVRSELFKSGRQITPVNVDSFILNFCMNKESYHLAYSYMEFLKEEKLKPNLATIGKCFKLFYLTNCDKVVEKTEELNILALYKELRKTYKLLDATTCENIIRALAITENWRECLKLLDEIKISADPSTTAYSVIAAAAFKNNENNLAWKLMDEVADKSRLPHSIAYLSYLQRCENAPSPDKCLRSTEVLFEFFRQFDVKCDAQVAEKINSIYRASQLNCKASIISNGGICNNCNQKLQKFKLNEQEFKSLKDAIFKNVIVGKNVFYRTTPDELKRFENFIANMKKYDVVIDGLNVAYSAGVKQSPQVFSALVASVVKHFVNENKRVLVLGRTHMQKWPGKNWSYVTKHADTFLAQSLSQDDPYLLYCALNSGSNTIIVSKDLMRSHVFKLKDFRLKILFGQWLTQSQYQLQFVNNQGKVFFKYPLPYIRTSQKEKNCWHIPYNVKDDVAENKWLCLSA